MKKFTQLVCMTFLFCGTQTINAQTPVTAAPLPQYDNHDVICFYNGSAKYPQVTDISALPWGQPATYDFAETESGEECMLVEGLGWLPIGLAKRQPGVLDMEYMHVDVYCNEETYFQIGFQGYGDGGSETYFPGFNYNTPGKWYGIDYPLNLMTKQGFNLGLTNVLRIGGGSHEYSQEIYLDNIFVFIGEPTNLYDDNQTSIVQNQKKEIFIYPSIINTAFNIDSECEIENVQVYDMTGKIVTFFEKESHDFNISHLSAGTYFIKARLMDGDIVCRKIIKQ